MPNTTLRINFHDLFVRVYVLMVGLSFGLGAVILSGGNQRFNGPSFDGPRDLVAWMPLLPPRVWWGLLFTFYGIALVMTLGRKAAVHVLRAGIVIFWFLAIAFCASILAQPTAALTGIVSYTAFGALLLIMSDHLHGKGWSSA